MSDAWLLSQHLPDEVQVVDIRAVRSVDLLRRAAAPRLTTETGLGRAIRSRARNGRSAMSAEGRIFEIASAIGTRSLGQQ
jgi:hypothetical protein